MNIHTLSQHDLYLNNGDVSCVNGFIKIETISQCNESSCFNYMDGDVENGDMNGEHGSMKIHTLYQQNILISLINTNNSDKFKMNADLNNIDVTCVIFLINVHTLSQFNVSSCFNEVFEGV